MKSIEVNMIENTYTYNTYKINDTYTSVIVDGEDSLKEHVWITFVERPNSSVSIG